MTLESMESLKTTSLLLEELDVEDVAFLESVATEVVFPAGALIFEADQDADQFYLVAEGKAGLEVVLEDNNSAEDKGRNHISTVDAKSWNGSVGIEEYSRTGED